MPWTTPATWTVGEEVTAALLNAQLRDNLNWLNVGALWGRARLTGTPPNVAHNLDTLVPLNTVDAGQDPSSMFNPTTHLFTIPEKGLYIVEGSFRFQSGGPTSNAPLCASLYRNASSGSPQFVGANVQGIGSQVTRLLQLAAGDTIGLDCWQYSGVAVPFDLGFGGSGNQLSIACIARVA